MCAEMFLRNFRREIPDGKYHFGKCGGKEGREGWGS